MSRCEFSFGGFLHKAELERDKDRLERKLEEYKDPQAMYKAQGSNAFTRAYRKTMTRDDKLRSNIERRDRLTERLKQLRGE